MIRKYASAGRIPKRVWDKACSQFFYLLYDACSDALLARWGMGRGGEV